MDAAPSYRTYSGDPDFCGSDLELVWVLRQLTLLAREAMLWRPGRSVFPLPLLPPAWDQGAVLASQFCRIVLSGVQLTLLKSPSLVGVAHAHHRDRPVAQRESNTNGSGSFSVRSGRGRPRRRPVRSECTGRWRVLVDFQSPPSSPSSSADKTQDFVPCQTSATTSTPESICAQWLWKVSLVTSVLGQSSLFRAGR